MPVSLVTIVYPFSVLIVACIHLFFQCTIGLIYSQIALVECETTSVHFANISKVF